MDQQVDAKDLARMLSFGRIVIGVAAFIAPRRFAQAWTGRPAEDVASPMATRGLAGRDVAIGVGTLLALEGDGPVRGWLEAQAIADGSDALATLSNFGDMAPVRRWLMLAVSASAACVAAKLASELDQ